MIRALLFDMDGVLVDSEGIAIAIGIEYFSSKGLHLTEKDFKNHIGTGEENFFSGPAEEKGFHDWSLKEASSFTRSKYLEMVKQKSIALAGVKEVVGSSRKAGLLIAVCSSAPFWKVLANIEAIGLAYDDFDAVISAADIRRNKPYGDIYQLALIRLGVAPEEAVVFEDSRGGLAAGIAAGCPTVGLETSIEGDLLISYGAKAVIKDLSAIGEFKDSEELEQRLFGAKKGDMLVYGANLIEPSKDSRNKEGLLSQALEMAKKARANAYAPYSEFKVGAALVSAATNKIYAGCNVENSSYGATICAERNAILSAIAAEGKIGIDLLVVVSDDNPPAPPCALCLQVLAEFSRPETEVVLSDLDGNKNTYLFKDLLPNPFIFPTMRK